MGYRQEDHDAPKREGSASSEAIIRDATVNSIAIADKSGCGSIAFPALATGVGGFPVDECARVMIRAAQDYAEEHPQSGVARVIFVLFNASDFQVFEREMNNIVKA